MAKKRIARWYTGSCGYHLCSPESKVFDLYFSTFDEMRNFANDMGWILKRI